MESITYQIDSHYVTYRFSSGYRPEETSWRSYNNLKQCMWLC